MDNSNSFTNRLQNLLDYYSLSASGLATKIGIQRSTISHVVSGRNKPSLDFVMKILHTFNEVTIEWLIDGKGSFPKLENSSINTIVKTIENPSPTFTKKIESERNENITDAVSELIPTKTNGKEIQKVILLYKDGSFESFIN
tara:strand:+ start:96 stop:521 length:426 start_codon:yes stop_codon:yes gene_type:complete